MGKHQTHLMTYKEFAEHIGATHGTVKRWAHDGMPVNREWENVPRVDPTEAQVWIDSKPRRPTTFDRKCFVYFAQREDGCIKIGFTSDVDRRMRELRKEFRIETPTVLASLPGDKRLELQFHKSFESAHVGEEWFTPTAELLAFITPLKRSA